MNRKRLTNLAAFVCLACSGGILSADSMTDSLKSLWNPHAILFGNACGNTIKLTIHSYLEVPNVYLFNDMSHQIEQVFSVVLPPSPDQNTWAPVPVCGTIDYIEVKEASMTASNNGGNGSSSDNIIPNKFYEKFNNNIPTMYTPAGRWLYWVQPGIGGTLTATPK